MMSEETVSLVLVFLIIFTFFLVTGFIAFYRGKEAK